MKAKQETKLLCSYRMPRDLVARARKVAEREALTITDLITKGLEAQLAELEAAKPKRGKRIT